MPAPSAGHQCNALAEIVVIAVAVVVSWATYGALAPEADSWASAMLAGAAAGAAGSAASQLAGDALGTQHGFDWGQVAVGAVGGAIGGAVASKLANANAFARGATEGAASYVGSYETEKLVGEPAHFSWAGLVADAVGSGAAAEIGPTAAERQAGMTNGTLAEKIEANAVQDVVTRETSIALGDNRVQSWQQIGEDVFGNALGNAAIAGIEHENAVSEQQQLQKIIDKLNAEQSAELGANTNAIMAQTGAQAMANIRAQGQATLDQDYASTEQSLEDRLASMPDPSLAASVAAVNGADGTSTSGIQTLETITVTPTPEQWMQNLGVNTPYQMRAYALMHAANRNGILSNGQAWGLLRTATTLDAEGNPQLNADILAAGVFNAFKSTNNAPFVNMTDANGNLDYAQTNAHITNKYEGIFANDPLATWFGVAAIASAKVGEGLWESSFADAAPGGLDADLQIIHQGLGQGNIAVFDSQYSLYQIYQVAGLDGIQAVVSSGVLGDPRSKPIQGVVDAYQQYDAARSLSSDDPAYMQHATAYLSYMANYEQRVILQPYYDQPYTADAILVSDAYDGTPPDVSVMPVTETLGQAINSAGQVTSVVPGLSNWWNPTAVNVLGSPVSFSGTNLENPDQRMQFVDQVSSTFMAKYAQPNGINQAIYWLQNYNRQPM